MSYQNPISGIPDPYEGYRVEGASEKQSGPGGPPDGEEPPNKNRGILAHLFKKIQKGIDAFLTRLGGSSSKSFEAKKTIQALKASLDILKLEDRSQDVDFLNSLAENWSRAIEESFEFKEKPKLLFQLFVTKILRYPENQPHTFGYYLTEHAGQKWVPFPYMELVQKIHQEHEKSPSSSALTEWIRLLEDTIQSLEAVIEE